MAKFGNRSELRLEQVHPALVEVLRDAIEIIDFTIICGHRNKSDQNEAYATNASHVKWPNSMHNTLPSLAVDIGPWPLDWRDTLAFARVYGVIEACAFQRDIALIWGGDWNGNGGSRDQTFMDIGHIEVEDI